MCRLFQAILFICLSHVQSASQLSEGIERRDGKDEINSIVTNEDDSRTIPELFSLAFIKNTQKHQF